MARMAISRPRRPSKLQVFSLTTPANGTTACPHHARPGRLFAAFARFEPNSVIHRQRVSHLFTHLREFSESPRETKRQTDREHVPTTRRPPHEKKQPRTRTNGVGGLKGKTKQHTTHGMPSVNPSRSTVSTAAAAAAASPSRLRLSLKRGISSKRHSSKVE